MHNALCREGRTLSLGWDPKNMGTSLYTKIIKEGFYKNERLVPPIGWVFHYP
jgi:hypothetical protein